MIPSRHSGAESDDGAKATTDTYFRMHTSRNQRTSRPIRVRCAFQSRNKRESEKRENPTQPSPPLQCRGASESSHTHISRRSGGTKGQRRGGQPPISHFGVSCLFRFVLKIFCIYFV